MAGCIRDDEMSLLSREETICDIDGNTLLAFGVQAVEKI